MKLARYEIVRELGKGAMGIVYLAKDPVIGRLVALKTIRLGAHADDEETKEFQQRFIREAQAAGILNHPAIVTVHDIGQDDASGTSFIAMEYVEGHNIKEVLNQGRTLTFDQIGDIISQVADALDFAHAKGIVHRDVKPANIILLEGHRAKITDFGIAKIASGAANLTTTGQFLGTPNYMAPEQIKGAPVDGRTDIFSLGICLYECLTRRKPFGGDSLTSISYKIVHEPFPPLHEINPQIPDGYEDVVAHALAKDPAKRYQRARDFATALRAVVRGERPVRPNEPLLEEETVVTRGGTERVPTLEVPFPEAEEASSPSSLGTKASGAAAAAAAAPSISAKAPAAPKQPVALRLRKTLTNVRTLPMWRRRISPPLFLGIAALLLAGLFGAVAAVRSKTPVVPPADTAKAARHERERKLRGEATALLRQGRVTDAYAKYEELSRLAPDSPYVTQMLQKLNRIRQQEEVGKQQIVQAKLKFDEGLALYNERKYPDAIARFQESVGMNPSSLEAAEYLKLAQTEQLKLEAARSTRSTKTTTPPTRVVSNGSKTSTGGSAAGGVGSTQAVEAAPSQFTTVFAHPFTDGRIVVRAGGDIVANETLFEEKPARLFRRASRSARPINVTHSVPAKNADVQIWVTVPAENINEHHVLPAVRLKAGGAHRLTVRYDKPGRKFTYELN
ncbi:MAG TPA: protein kinase [Thermoanaerobaculia bacterium]|nr:protein kinase [Thermoanaerobaculia bacterium]